MWRQPGAVRGQAQRLRRTIAPRQQREQSERAAQLVPFIGGHDLLLLPLAAEEGQDGQAIEGLRRALALGGGL